MSLHSLKCDLRQNDKQARNDICSTQTPVDRKPPSGVWYYNNESF